MYLRMETYRNRPNIFLRHKCIVRKRQHEVSLIAKQTQICNKRSTSYKDNGNNHKLSDMTTTDIFYVVQK